jgi:hypothetical protein
MAHRPSSIDKLPSQIRDEIKRLRERGKSIDEILAHLHLLLDAPEVSRSALGRHIQKLEQVGERVRRSRALGEALASQLGDASESKIAGVNIEMVHSLLFDLLSLADEQSQEGEEVKAMLRNPKALALVSEATQRLTQASRTNLQFIADIEKRATDKERRAAALRAETVAKANGVSSETIAAIKAGIFGVKEP